MSFLAPIWLWAAAAVAVPTLIHLLARGQGRTIALGTIRFLPQSRSHRLRHLRPTGLLRYLLRATLLTVLAVALAAPRWWHQEAPGDARRALVDPSLIADRARLEPHSPELYAALDAVPESERLWLAPGLPTGPAPVDGESPRDVWSLVSEAGLTLPPGTTLEVFVVDRAAALEGARPALTQRVIWHSAADPDENRWIQRVVSSPEGLAVTVGTSSEQATTFASFDVPPGELASLGIRAEESGDDPGLVLSEGGSRGSDDRARTPSPPDPLAVRIEAGADRDEDAAVVGRAAEAVAAHLGRPLVTAPGTTGDARIDLNVALGVPTTLPAARISLTDGDRGVPCRSSAWAPSLPDPRLELRHCPQPGGISSDAGVIWRDSRGNPLLTGTDRATGTDYQWHGRLDSSGSNLSESGLPHLLLGLIAPDDGQANGGADAGSDRRRAPGGHGQPRWSAAPPGGRPDPLPERIAWALVALLFLLDRMLVRRSA